jgi:hypothetical protein
MERLKEDIDLKAEKFEHIDYYDALLRDGISKEIAVATDEVHDFDSRRKPLITVNPLFAKTSELPPVPSVEDLTFEHISLNLPSIAKNTLRDLEEGNNIEMSSTFDPVNETLSKIDNGTESNTESVYDSWNQNRDIDTEKITATEDNIEFIDGQDQDNIEFIDEDDNVEFLDEEDKEKDKNDENDSNKESAGDN